MSDYTEPSQEYLNKEETVVEITEDTVPFWFQDPNILFNKEYMFQFFPTGEMSFNEKLNAITRLIIIISLITFLMTKNIRIILVFVICLLSIYLLYFYKSKENEKYNSNKLDLENFETTNPAIEVLREKNIQVSNDIFDEETPDNPFSNVLNTDFDYNPQKKPAPPSNSNTILQNAKQMVSDLHPEDKTIANKLFGNLQDQYVFEQSLQPFNSNPSTTIPNDQTGFAEFCYGSMISSKEGNLFSLARNLSSYKV
jgi:Ca2+/Na+ antiporter